MTTTVATILHQSRSMTGIKNREIPRNLLSTMTMIMRTLMTMITTGMQVSAFPITILHPIGLPLHSAPRTVIHGTMTDIGIPVTTDTIVTTEDIMAAGAEHLIFVTRLIRMAGIRIIITAILPINIPGEDVISEQTVEKLRVMILTEAEEMDIIPPQVSVRQVREIR